MPVRYIDGLQVAVMERNPVRESLGLSHRGQCLYQYRVVLTEDQSRRDRVEAERFAEALWPFADHRLSWGGKDVDNKPAQSHAPGLLKPEFPSFSLRPFDFVVLRRRQRQIDVQSHDREQQP